MGPLTSELHANRNLPRSLRYGVRQNTVDAKRNEHDPAERSPCGEARFAGGHAATSKVRFHQGQM
jgi:hypothetical protein